jgi:hypothetical protein
MNKNKNDENYDKNYHENNDENNDDDIWEDWDYTKYDVSCNYTEQRVLSVEEKKRMEDIEKENIALIKYLFEETNTTKLQHFPKLHGFPKLQRFSNLQRFSKLQHLPNKKHALEKLREEK